MKGRKQLRLMCVVAHPDDESLGMGGALAKYAAEGVETYVVTATKGERGRSVSKEPLTPEAVGRLRAAELGAAADELGVREVSFLEYCDGELDQADPSEVVGRIVDQLRRVKPHVVLTFAPDGAYGHPDHIAISQFTTAAVVRAADREYRVAKLYYLAWRADKWAAYQAALKKLVITVDGVERQATPWPDWAVTTVVDTNEFHTQVWRAVSCHRSQIAIYGQLSQLSAEHHRALWGSQEFYRAMSLVNGGRRLETDLFEGLRETSEI